MLRALIHNWREAVTAILKVAVLVPIAMAFVSQLQSYRSPTPELIPRVTHSPHGRDRVEWVSKTPKTARQFTTILMQTFGATAVLGIIAVVSQFIWRRLHHVTTIVFFGVVALFMVINAVSELWSSGLQPSLCTDYVLMVLLLAVCVAGVVVEMMRQQREYASHAA